MSGITISCIWVTYIAKLPEAWSFKGWSTVAIGALGLGKIMSASESSTFVSEVVVKGEVSFVYAESTIVLGTV